jgi:hypothetical protein
MMIKLTDILRDHQTEFLSTYGSRLSSVHHRALEHILDCHTCACGEILSQCETCQRNSLHFPSCGNRFCPSCQHLANRDWLDRQQQKLLPVDYYMVTFTVPRQLRPFVWHHQHLAYKMLFDCAVATLQSFFGRDKKLLGKAGLTVVLHTHARNLDFHPHVHLIVPAGSLHKRSGLWRQKTGDYLFNADNLARVFRGKFMHAMAQAEYRLPPGTPKEWNADCKHVGRGDKALTYLARYLYRGVISEDNILRNEDGKVTFRYKNSTTGQYQTITEPAVAFLWRVIQHVLPKGFRRARDFGFLHGNAKRTLQRIQLMLKVRLTPSPKRHKAAFCCPDCGTKLEVIWHKRYKLVPLAQRTNAAMDCA